MNSRRYITVLVCFLFGSCLEEDEMKKPFVGFAPLLMNDGWQISTPSREGIDSLELIDVYRNVYSDDALWMMKSMLVFRNGKLVAESYLKDDSDRNKQAAIWSCTKQTNSIITGIAITNELLSLQDSIGKYLPSYIAQHPDKKGIKIENLLTMRSGIDFDNGVDNDPLREHEPKDATEYMLDFKMYESPGADYRYKDSDPHLLSAVMQNATGKPLDEYGKEVLFDKLGMTHYYWERYNGTSIGSWGILTTPRELAKIGQCVLDSGRWNNQQVIPLSWWQQMISPHTLNAHGDAAFGYLWWSVPSKGYYFMWGHGGQFAFAVPAKRLLIVVTSFENVDADFYLQYEQIVSIVDQVVEIAQ
jgi:CubicO group peptidase (beta-lactamase class C family)